MFQIETRIMPADIVASKSQQLGLKPEVKKAAEIIAKNFTDHCVEEGKKPATIAGVSFFMAIMKVKTEKHIDVEHTWRSICDVVGIGIQTMKDCYNNALIDEKKLLPGYLQSQGKR